MSETESAAEVPAAATAMKTKRVKTAKPKRDVGSQKKRASAPKKKPAKRGAAKRKSKRPSHWSDTHAQLVIHAAPELVAKLDRKLEALGKKLKVERPTRGSIVRALVMRAVA